MTKCIFVGTLAIALLSSRTLAPRPAFGNAEVCYATGLIGLSFGDPPAVRKYYDDMMGTWTFERDMGLTWSCGGTGCDASACSVCLKLVLKVSDSESGPWTFVHSEITSWYWPNCGMDNVSEQVTIGAYDLLPNKFYQLQHQVKHQTATSDCDDTAGYAGTGTDVIDTH